MHQERNHTVDIHYCTGCRWLLRSAWMAQELLTTFEDEIGELTLHPGSGGIFEVHVDGQRIWSRKDMGGFPDITRLKQLVRDAVSPERSLGHSDRTNRNE
jgi:selenoprotein W-related protein